jgi:type I restriction enzyme S subunit
MRHYIDSGIDWIGKIPEGWKTNKFKHLFRIKKILAGKLGYDVLSVTQQGLKVKNIISNEGQVANDYTNYQLVFPNDFVMNHMDLLTGYVDVSKQEGVTSPDYRTFYAINPKEVNNKYYLYIFQFCYKTRLFYNLGQGVSNFGRWRLPAEQQKEFVLPYPSILEQIEIVKYLDEKCGDIDSLINLQEQMIEKLIVYKQSVITEAVTKGLDPNANLISSGIAWIGSIPKGWEITKLKYIGSYINGYAFKPEDWSRNGLPIIRIQDLSGSNNDPNYFSGSIDNKYLVKKGDILISWAATLDAFIWNKEEGWLNQHIFKAVINDNVDKNFFYWLIKIAMQNMNNDNKHGIFMQHVTTGVFNNFQVPLPSLDEQHAIAEYLDTKCCEIDRLIETKRRKIETLKEYKKSVIYEAVTGKTDLWDNKKNFFQS